MKFSLINFKDGNKNIRKLLSLITRTNQRWQKRALNQWETWESTERASTVCWYEAVTQGMGSPSTVTCSRQKASLLVPWMSLLSTTIGCLSSNILLNLSSSNSWDQGDTATDYSLNLVPGIMVQGCCFGQDSQNNKSLSHWEGWGFFLEKGYFLEKKSVQSFPSFACVFSFKGDTLPKNNL